MFKHGILRFVNIESQILRDHALAAYCTYQIGGKADWFLAAHSIEELLAGLEWAKENKLPSFVFGRGSNLLFDDAGFRGLVIRMEAKEIEVQGKEIVAEAGALCAQVVKAAADAGLSGLEAWNGLPGTVGGAVYGNAGCFGVETKDILVKAEIFTPETGVQTHAVSWFEYGYRTSKLKREGGVVLRARFKLNAGDKEAIAEEMKAIAKARIQKQPPGLSTGSFFKNPSVEQSAGWLLDQAGLKGFELGRMKISDQHANFFVNKGGATAQEVLVLEDYAKQKVFEQFGVKLEREIVFVPCTGLRL